MKERQFHCKFCHQNFVHENRFMNHKCTAMKRDEEFRSPIGQAGWILYQKWMKAYRRQIPHSDAFLKSKYFSPFMRFAKFVKRVHIPDTDSFIWLMREKDISPVLWCRDEIYSLYLEFLDRRGDPTKRAQTTIDTIFQIADAAECDVSEVFDVITSSEMLQLLRERRLSPWILLRSPKFKKFFATSVAKEEQIIFEAIIRPAFWAEKFRNNETVVKQMDSYVKELNL